MNEKIWGVYLNGFTEQEITSKNTSVKQIPRVHAAIKDYGLSKGRKRLLDIGCGKFPKEFGRVVEEFGLEYFGCDPFNQSHEFNLESITSCGGGGAQIVTINNVLNTIKEESIWLEVLTQAYDALDPDNGVLLIIVYEGSKLAKERTQEKETGVKLSKLTPTITKDGFQHRKKTQEYVPYVESVFPYVCLNSLQGGAGKVIVATKSPTVKINLRKK